MAGEPEPRYTLGRRIDGTAFRGAFFAMKERASAEKRARISALLSSLPRTLALIRPQGLKCPINALKSACIVHGIHLFRGTKEKDTAVKEQGAEGLDKGGTVLALASFVARRLCFCFLVLIVLARSLRPWTHNSGDDPERSGLPLARAVLREALPWTTKSGDSGPTEMSALRSFSLTRRPAL